MAKKSSAGNYGIQKVGKREIPLKKDGSIDKRYLKGPDRAIYEVVAKKKKALTAKEFEDALEVALGLK